MHPSIAAALLAALLSVGWFLGRRRVPLVRDPDTADVAALNRAQIALVQSGAASQPELSSPGLQRTLRPEGRLVGWRPPQPGSVGTAPQAAGLPARLAAYAGSGPGQGRAYLAVLQAQYRGGAKARLEAIQAAHRWGDRLCLPLLRRGLRDCDPQVMHAAVVAIERFRGRTAAAGPETMAQRPAAPRRVSRTR